MPTTQLDRSARTRDAAHAVSQCNVVPSICREVRVFILRFMITGIVLLQQIFFGTSVASQVAATKHHEFRNEGDGASATGTAGRSERGATQTGIGDIKWLRERSFRRKAPGIQI